MSGRRTLTLPQQATALRVHGFSVDRTRASLQARGLIRPSETCASYEVLIVYRLKGSPKVYVLDDQVNGTKPPPHVYSRDSTGRYPLCLFTGPWDRSLWLAESTVPWTAEWLFYYESWLVTGEWQGGGTVSLMPTLLPNRKQQRLRATLALRGH